MGFWNEQASPKILAYGAVFYSALGGFLIGLAFLQCLYASDRYSWIYESLTGLGFLLYGVVDVVQLVRRGRSVHASDVSRSADLVKSRP